MVNNAILMQGEKRAPYRYTGRITLKFNWLTYNVLECFHVKKAKTDVIYPANIDKAIIYASSTRRNLKSPIIRNIRTAVVIKNITMLSTKKEWIFILICI